MPRPAESHRQIEQLALLPTLAPVVRRRRCFSGSSRHSAMVLATEIVDRRRVEPPRQIRPVLGDLRCEFRRSHPDWGARKLLKVLRGRHPEIVDWPVASTAADLLARRGLVRKRRRRHPHEHPGVVPIATYAPITGHGLLSTETLTAKPIFERTVREYGVPRAIRTDNGVPFTTTSLRGLSNRNVWWMRLGIVHHRIHPSQPQEHGAHERLHRTMKRRAITPVQRTCASQQKPFDAFRTESNTERPHEALQLEPSASRYGVSPRAYPPTLPTIEYPRHFLIKKITDAGTFRFHKYLLHPANALVDQHIGLAETDDGVCSIYFTTVLRATLDERDYIIRG